jgi:hypothetical protein
VIVEVGTETFAATATTTTGKDRDALFERYALANSAMELYQARTTRQVPVVALYRRGDGARTA